MNALGSIPDVVAHNVLDAKDKVVRNGRLSLAQVLDFAKRVVRNSLLVLHSLFDNDCLGEGTLSSLVVN